MLRESCPDGITPGGIRFEGFLHLQRIFLEQGDARTVWSTVRHFGFNDNLDRPDAWIPQTTILRAEEPVSMFVCVCVCVCFFFKANDCIDEIGCAL
jgi:hypothetical protein